MAPGGRQAGAGTTPEPRGEGQHMDMVPPPSSSLSTRTTTGQPAAPPQPPPNATLQAGATLGSGVLPPTTATAGPPSAPPGQEEGCPCPHVPQHKPGAQQGAAAKGQAPHAYVPTPRTEEAAWAASALTVLLVLLTLAVLYTRLHRKFRKSQSLYWAPGDAGQESISAVIQRRLLRPHGRHKQRHRQRRLLLQEASSESSDS
ncbi:tumor protein p53-inducible protein 13 [Emydura macquarii macquarii]|uniref:tumor protein p53-inducible protein 13 n=1 Tax=Emydura macquarii macquarii TaxID=1129001 RepID=UPI00352AB284